MRTVQKTYTLFNIAELEGEAVEKAYTDWLAKGQEYPYAAFNSNTLEAFCNLFRVACTYYRYDSQTYCYRFHTKYEESTEELSGIRLRTFIYNNFHYGLYSAVEQLQGQIASAKIPLSRMISPALYWVMTADDFTLDINNPEEPKVLVVGNNPDRQGIYGAALGLYNSRIVKLINKKKRLKSAVIIDELPTIYMRGLDNLIATARSNKVAVMLGFQDFSQLKRDYGDKESAVICNTVGNVFAGQVVAETAKTLSERFGKIVQLRESHSVSNENVTTSTNTQLETLIPASKISNLTQGMFVGSVADNFDERIEQKIFHAEIVIDNDKVKAETAAYVPIPEISSFVGEDGKDHMEEIVKENYYRVKADVAELVRREIARIEADPDLAKLLPKKKP